MTHEPRGFVSDAEHSVELVSRNALLAGAQQMRGEYPFSQEEFGTFIDGADSDGELVPAHSAVIPARPHRLTTKGLHLVLCATERTIGTIGPADAFKVFAGLCFIVVDRISKVTHVVLSVKAV